MLPHLKVYIVSWLLLFAVYWHSSSSSPLGALDKLGLNNNEMCATYSRALLENVTNAVALDSLFRGINCSEQSVEINLTTKTASACQPSQSQEIAVCTGPRNTNFDQIECLQNIVEDLKHYKAVLLNYSDPSLRSTVLAINDLLEHCFSSISPEDPPSLKSSSAEDHTFDDRLQLCKILKGFRVRVITIARILSHVIAGGHRK